MALGGGGAGTFRYFTIYYAMANTHLESPGEPMSGPLATDTMNLPEGLGLAIEAARDRKAQDLVLLDLREISDATDYFLIASGRSDLQVKAVADHIIDELRSAGVRPSHVEGLRTGNWVLIDYFDFVVHVFHPGARDFYQLERLWGDAPTLHLEE